MKSGKLGIVSALLASACCVLPAIALLLGVSTFAFGTFVGKYHWYLQGAAVCADAHAQLPRSALSFVFQRKGGFIP